jgi:hypothetical protein
MLDAGQVEEQSRIGGMLKRKLGSRTASSKSPSNIIRGSIRQAGDDDEDDRKVGEDWV